MGSIRYITSGESHGKGLTAIIEGIPSNVELTIDFINKELSRRQMGYGRGGRMKIETDKSEILSGVRFGRTLGTPVALFIENKDWENWKEVMTPSPPAPLPLGEGGQRPGEGKFSPVTRPRPGHADLSGAIKYNQRDIRNILERSSARETAARVAVGAVAKRLLDEFGIKVYSWVTEIGGIGGKEQGARSKGSVYYSSLLASRSSLLELFDKAEGSDVRCPDPKATEAIKQRIDEARNNGDSLGGIFEIVVSGVPVGLGSHVQWDRKLNARLAMALMSIQAIKGVEIGLGFDAGRMPGSEVHDEIFYKISPDPSLPKRGKSYPPLEKGDKGGFYRKTNNAGGIEGGMSNGEDIVLRAVMKPIPTLYKPLKSVDIETKEIFEASIERSDICAVPAASVVGEAVVAIEIANAMLDKFGGDSLEEMKRNYEGYIEYVKGF